MQFDLETLSAFGADLRPFVTVNGGCVSLKISVCGERRWTLVALEVSFTEMNGLFVMAHVTVLGEALPTIGTTVGPILSLLVNQGVNAKAPLGCEYFFTN